MNRIRMSVFAGLLAVGGSGLTAPSVRAQAPCAVAGTPAPRYYYAWGPNGWGYYYHPAAPPPARPRTTPPSAYREWPTGRNVNLAKPWLRPLP